MLEETKGVSAVQLNGVPVTGGWNVSCLPFGKAQLQALPWERSARVATASERASPATPRLFKGLLTVPAGKLGDTWLSTRGWGKGSVVINGENIGRYWESQGPQHSMCDQPWAVKSFSCPSPFSYGE